MKVSRMKLLNLLDSISKGLATKEVLVQSTSFIFRDSQVVTYNDEVALHAQTIDGLDITGVVPANQLLTLLSRFSGEEVDIEVSESELLLKCGRGKAGLLLSTEICLPLKEIKLPKRWMDLPEDFETGLKICIPSVAKDMTYPLFASLHITSEYIEASNTIVLTRWNYKKKINIEELLISAKAAKIISDFSAKQIGGGKDWVHFKNDDGVILSCRTNEGEFPETSRHFEIDHIGELEFPADFPEVLERARTFFSGMVVFDNSVIIEITEKGILNVKGEGNVGWYNETCRTKWEGGAIKFSINPIFLKKVLETTKTAKISEDKIVFSTNQLKHVVALEAM